MGYGLGIDVGTSYTAAAIIRDGRAEMFELGSHSAAVPSVLLLRNNGSDLVGETAEWRAATEPGRIARQFKRRMGDPVPMIVAGTPLWVALEGIECPSDGDPKTEDACFETDPP